MQDVQLTFSTEGFASAGVVNGSERATVDGATRLQPLVPLVRRAKHGYGLILAALLLAFSISTPGSGEGAQTSKNQPALATQTASFGPVVPGKFGAPGSVMVPFSVPISQASSALGYHVTAISSFVFTPSKPGAGGKSVTAADLLVGITNVSSTLGAGSSAAIATGFDYDPSAVRGARGTSAFSGPGTQRATLADLLPGREILRAGGSPVGGAIPAGGGNLTFTLGIAVPTQFFTPGSFSGTVSVIVSQ